MAKPSPAKLFALKALVAVLGVAILVAAGIVVYGVATRLGKPAPQTTGTVPPPGEPTTLALPPGSTILETDLDGGRILLRVRLPDNTQRLILYDAASGARLGAFDLRTP